MKKSVFLFLLSILICIINPTRGGKINSWDIRNTYDFSGNVIQYTLIFSLESGLGPDEYFKIAWPFSLGSISSIKGSLYLFENELLVS